MLRMAWLIYNVLKTSYMWFTACCGVYTVLGGMYVYRCDCCLQSALSGVLPIAERARSITLFFLNLAVYEIMWENIVAIDRPQMTRAHAHCMLDAKGHKHTLRIHYTYCFSTTTITRTHLYVTLYVHYLSCLFFPTSLCISGVSNLFSL
jgi:hypothetical protein